MGCVQSALRFFFEAHDVINDDLIEYNWIKVFISHEASRLNTFEATRLSSLLSIILSKIGLK